MRNSFFRLKKQHKTLITMDSIRNWSKKKHEGKHTFKNMMVDAQIDSEKRHTKED